ncbi:unnamed protein product [Caenorhabditis brenneri]
MIDLNFFFSYARPTTLSDLTDRDFRAEFRRPASSPLPSIFQSPYGAVGQERQAAPTSAPRSTPEAFGPLAGFRLGFDAPGRDNNNAHQGEPAHHHNWPEHQQQPQQQQQMAMRPPHGRPAHVEQGHRDRHLRNRNAAPQPHHRQGRAPHEPRVERPACCCFCYGTAKVEAAAAGRPAPPKDGPGYWSGHHSITDGRVV